MIKVEFSQQDLKNIEHDRFNHPIPRVQRRMEVTLAQKPRPFAQPNKNFQAFVSTP